MPQFNSRTNQNICIHLRGEIRSYDVISVPVSSTSEHSESIENRDYERMICFEIEHIGDVVPKSHI